MATSNTPIASQNGMLEKPPLISVIVRTKDRPSLLKKALQSLVEQKWPHLDVIVINDGGQCVAHVIDVFLDQLPIQHKKLDPGQGRSPAANIGISLAKGEWVAFLDDDDIFLPDGLQLLANAIQDDHTVYYGRVLAYLYQNDSPEKEHRHLFRIFGHPFNKNLLFHENFIPIVGCIIPKRELLSEGGIDESFSCFEDWDLFFRLSHKLAFHFVDADVAEYRVRKDSFITSATKNDQQFEGRTQFYRKHWHFITPEVLSNMQFCVKTKVVPFEVKQELRPFLQEKNLIEKALHKVEEESIQRKKWIEFIETENEGRKKWIANLETTIQENTAHQRNLEEQITRLLPYENIVQEEIESIFISIIIVNFNGRHHLERCLPSVLNTKKARFEIIVVDNASTDNSVTWLQKEYPKLTLLAQETNLGFGKANIIGAQKARGQFVALLNSDTEVTPDWLWHLLRPFILHQDIGATCSTLRLLDHPEILNARGGGMTRLGFGYDIDFGKPCEASHNVSSHNLKEVFFPSGAAMVMRRDDFLGDLGFDASYFMYHEDVDLGWKIWLAGKRTVVSSKSIVYHQFGGTTKVEKGIGWRELMGSRHNLRSLIKYYAPRNLLKALKDLLLLWWRQRAYRIFFHTVFWNLYYLPSTLKSRFHIQNKRKRSDLELIERGLIFQEVYPAPSPELPINTSKNNDEKNLASSILFPGYYSAVNRLGAGWYPPEQTEHGWVRATCGNASCRLYLGKYETGTLSFDVYLPEEIAVDFQVNITVNSEEHVSTIKSGLWEKIDIPTQTDEQGNMAITLKTPNWSPHTFFNNNDHRDIGILIRSVRFRSKETSAKPAYTKCSVLITTFNRWSILEKTLTELCKQTIQNFEVIVVDDGSTDNAWQHLSAWQQEQKTPYELRIYRQKNTGQGLARNHGLQYTTGELIAFLGDDIIPNPKWLEEHLNFHNTTVGPCAVVGLTDWYRSGMQVTPLLEMVNTEGHQFGYGFMSHGEDVPYSCFYTSNISLPRDVLGATPFDPNFQTYGWEDLELGYRLSLQGLRIRYNEKAKAEHLHPTSLKSFFQRQKQVGKAVHKFLALHPDLASDKFMPSFQLPIWFPIGKVMVSPFIPFFNYIDTLGIQLPKPLLRRILLYGFLIGVQEGSSEE